MDNTPAEGKPNFKEGDKVIYIHSTGEYEGTIVPNSTGTTVNKEENADTFSDSVGLCVRFKHNESVDFSCDIVFKDQYDVNVYEIPRSLLKLKVNDSPNHSEPEESLKDLISSAESFRYTGLGTEDKTTVQQEPTTEKSEKNTLEGALESAECLDSLETATISHQLSETVQQETETSITDANAEHSEGLYSEKYTCKINQPLEEEVEPDYQGNNVSTDSQEGANNLSENSRVDIETAGWEEEMTSNSPYNLRSSKSRTHPVEYGEDVARSPHSSTRGNCDTGKCDHDSVYQKNSDYSASSSVQAATYADKAKKGLEKQEGDSSLKQRMTNGIKSILNIGSSKEACSEPASGSYQNNVSKIKVDPYHHQQTQTPNREDIILISNFDVHGQRLQKGSLLAIRKNSKKGLPFEELGTVKEFVNGTEIMVCILLMESSGGNFSGVYRGIEIFECDKNCGVIVPLTHFYENNSIFHILHSGNEAIEQIETCPEFPETNKLASPISLEELKKYRNYQRGIQGKTNSCYIDTILFSLFGFCDNFDYILEPNETDCGNNLGGEVKKIIAQQIVNPLRTSFFCPSKSVTNLRYAMESLSPKLVHAYMDAEEFVFLLFENCLRLDGFIQFRESSNFLHQIFIDDELNFQPPRFTTTQLLLEMSMCRSDIQFKTIPEPALIIAMPRCDGELKHFDKILPNRQIDVSLLMSSAQIKCCVCQTRAFYKCKSCFSLLKDDPGIKSTFFCSDCNKRVHAHEFRMKHKPEGVKHTTEFPKENLNLLAVLCIKSHHYVCFVRCDNPDGAEWVFFDSDPASGNPKIDVLEGFEETMIRLEKNQNLSPKEMECLPTMMKRMLSDIYICIYIKPKEDEDL